MNYQKIAWSIRESIKDTKDFNWNKSERQGFAEGIRHVVENLAMALDLGPQGTELFEQACGITDIE